MTPCHLSSNSLVISHCLTLPLGEKSPYSEFFWSILSRILTDNGEILCISPYAVQFGKIRNRKTPNIDTFPQCILFFLWMQLTYFRSILHLYVPWKHQISGFLTFSRGIEIEHWAETDQTSTIILVEVLNKYKEWSITLIYLVFLTILKRIISKIKNINDVIIKGINIRCPF